jgi:hypothetical protein
VSGAAGVCHRWRGAARTAAGRVLERATIREVRHPGIDAPPEPRYRASRELSDYVRCRDLTCRWPGCDKPSYQCDLDHTVPYPVGPTHASNIKCYCRFHHLLKTFYVGQGGWRERQLPDGTLILTSQTGHTYTTHPGSIMLFPSLCASTGELWRPGEEPTVEPRAGRGAMMPKRRRPREYYRQRAIEAERRLNDEYVAERNKPHPSEGRANRLVPNAVGLPQSFKARLGSGRQLGRRTEKCECSAGPVDVLSLSEPLRAGLTSCRSRLRDRACAQVGCG